MSGNVLSLLTQSRWAMKREALEQLVALANEHLAAYLPGGPHAAPADRAAGEAPRLTRRALFSAPAVAHPQSERLGVRDGVAILPVVGPLCRYASWIQEVCGLTSYQLVALDLQLALDDPAIGAILVHLDTPGGEVDGCAELAAALHRARGRKPLVAMVSDGAASAGYWLAAACDEIVVSPSAYVGSIGVWFELVDGSEAEARDGFRRVRIVSSQSPNKVPDPFEAAGRAVLQREADQFADAFLEAVAGFRGTTAEALIAAGDGGAVFIGRHAIARGLADRVGTSEEVLAELAAAARVPTRRVAAAAPVPTTTPESVMPPKAQSTAAHPARALQVGDEVTCTVTREVAFQEGARVTVREIRENVTALVVQEGDAEKRYLLADEVEGGSAAPAEPPAGSEDDDEVEDAPAAVRAAFPQAAAALVAEGEQAGATAERARILGILALPGATAQPAVLQACLADAACTRAQAAERLLASQPVAGRAALEALLAAERAGAPSAEGAPSASGDGFVERVLAARALVRGTP